MRTKIPDTDGWTPLHDAAAGGHLDACKIILKFSVDKNPRSNNNITPLHSAASNHHKAICELIASQVGDKNTMDNFGRTPESMWIRASHMEAQRETRKIFGND